VEGDSAEGRVDLSGIDFEKLAELFAVSPKVTAERLKDEAEKQAKSMAERNPTRVAFVERLEKLVAEYNAGSIDAERFFQGLKAFIDDMDDEEQRAAREELSDEELAIFDLLTKPEPILSGTEALQVKAAARGLLDKLHRLTGVIDWTKGQETRGAVLSEIRTTLDNGLPMQPYPEKMLLAKIDGIWEFVLRRYADQASSRQAGRS
jgi:type I restriction enzyme R subunit